MTRWFFVVLLCCSGWAEALEYSGPPESELQKRDLDHLNQLKGKKQVREARYKAWYEHVRWREALDKAQEKARQDFIAERDKKQSRGPASSVADDRQRHKEQKRLVASEKEKARRIFVQERDLAQLSRRKSVRRDLRRQIQILERELESD